MGTDSGLTFREDKMTGRDRMETDRPKVSAEVRAWIIAAAVLVSYGFYMTWWAATLTTKLDAALSQLADIENRLRNIEYNQNSDRAASNNRVPEKLGR